MWYPIKGDRSLIVDVLVDEGYHTHTALSGTAECDTDVATSISIDVQLYLQRTKLYNARMFAQSQRAIRVDAFPKGIPMSTVYTVFFPCGVS